MASIEPEEKCRHDGGRRRTRWRLPRPGVDRLPWRAGRQWREQGASHARAAEELSYRPDQRARLLGRTRSHTIGIAFSLHDEACRQLVETLYHESEDSGYDLVLSPIAPTRPEARAAQSLLDYRCEALILIGPELAGRALTSLAERTPMVVVGRAVRSSNVDVVRTDDTTGARLAVEHLIGLGHQRIAHVHGNRAAGAAERRRGYRDAMRDAGLDTFATAGCRRAHR